MQNDQDYPKHYVARKVVAAAALTLDGKLDERAWQTAPWTADFVDIADGPTPRKRTRAKILWDDHFLYIGAHLEEDEIWANLTQHDDVIFHDNDFEVFVDPAGSTHYYKEFEVNALGTTWDLALNKPYGNGGYENSTRTFGNNGWDMFPKAAVLVDGVLNDPGAHNKGWTVEIALPMAGLLENQSVGIPEVGDYWRLSFSRVEWRVLNHNGAFRKDPAYPHEDNWVWQNMGKISMHEPERWGIVQFADKDGSHVSRDPSWPVRRAAAGIYDAQKAWAADHNGTYTALVKELRPLLTAGSFGVENCQCSILSLEVLDDGKRFEARVTSGDNTRVATVLDDRKITVKEL